MTFKYDMYRTHNRIIVSIITIDTIITIITIIIVVTIIIITIITIIIISSTSYSSFHATFFKIRRISSVQELNIQKATIRTFPK